MIFSGVVGDLHLGDQKVTWKKLVDWISYDLQQSLKSPVIKKDTCLRLKVSGEHDDIQDHPVPVSLVLSVCGG